jgi:hypothetical protein
MALTTGRLGEEEVGVLRVERSFSGVDSIVVIFPVSRWWTYSDSVPCTMLHSCHNVSPLRGTLKDCDEFCAKRWVRSQGAVV